MNPSIRPKRKQKNQLTSNFVVLLLVVVARPWWRWRQEQQQQPSICPMCLFVVVDGFFVPEQRGGGGGSGRGGSYSSSLVNENRRRRYSATTTTTTTTITKYPLVSVMSQVNENNDATRFARLEDDGSNDDEELRKKRNEQQRRTRKQRPIPEMHQKHKNNNMDGIVVVRSLVSDREQLRKELLSYIYAIQRLRKQQQQLGNKGNTAPNLAANSLVHFLEMNPLQEKLIDDNDWIDLEGSSSNNDDDDNDRDDDSSQNNNKERIEQLLERSLIMALRLAGETNDHKLILRLISSAITFANNYPVLTPRIFSEAIGALSRTQANVAKIKSMWSMMRLGTESDIDIDNNNNSSSSTNQKIPPYLSTPPTAIELNIFLKALASRGKYRACEDRYRHHSSAQIRDQYRSGTLSSVYIRPDAYTISTVFSALVASITSTPKKAVVDSAPKEGHTSVVDIGRHNVNASAAAAAATAPLSSSWPSPTSSSLYAKLKGLSCSICWEWNAAVNILGSLDDNDENNDDGTKILATSSQLNNHAYNDLLKLQSKAQYLYGANEHRNGPQLTMAILDHMLHNNVMPDEMTCAQVITALGNVVESTTSSFPSSWMRPTDENDDTITSGRNLAVDFLQQMKSDPRLPGPNQYCYSAAITACARGRDHVMALKLLEEMRRNSVPLQDELANNTRDQSISRRSKRSVSPPNTWVYNAVLLSLTGPPPSSLDHSYEMPMSGRRRREKKLQSNIEDQRRGETVLTLLEQMKDDHALYNWTTRPDTVTYNTILGVKSISSIAQHQQQLLKYQNPQQSDGIVNILFDQMEDDGIVRDAITYRKAISASSSNENVLKLLGKSLTDSAFRSKDKKGSYKRMDDLTNIFNVGLSLLASREDYGTFMKVMELMEDNSITMNAETISALIYVFGKSGKCGILVNLLEAIGSGIDHDETTPEKLSNMGLPTFIGKKHHPALRACSSHYTEAVRVCLRVNEFKYAHTILSMMRSQGIEPTPECMECFVVAYAEAAMNAASKEGRSVVLDAASKSRARADNAYKIAMALARPRPNVLGRVARACATTGQWKSARAVLRSIHRGLISCTKIPPGRSEWNNRRAFEGVRGTQSYLLRECAMQGNVEAALWYTRDIQDFAKALRSIDGGDSNHHAAPDPPRFSEVPLDDDLFANLRDYLKELPSLSTSGMKIGMHSRDWISLAKAASKSDNWRVGINTLQFIRPYVERTNPRFSGRDSRSVDDRYEQLMPAVTAVVRCLESQSQYAWATRVIEDWITWSGRKPRVDAVLSAIRVLSSNGQGDEVKRLLEHCTSPDLGSCHNKKDIGYEEMLYIGAVTSLHQSGLYDDADEVFISGVSDGFLPFDFRNINGNFSLDLHGLNLALAHSAVRIALRQQAAAFSDADASSTLSDMMIITGRGKNSAFRLRPILRPEVQRMLVEEFYPPLNTLSVPGNLGAITVLAEDVKAWQDHQEEQKGARMMDLAALLRNLTSPDRLKRSIALTMRASNERDSWSDEGKHQS